MEKFTLKYFVFGLLQLAYKNPGPNGWGNPCSNLLESFCLKQESFVERIFGDYSNDSHEYRLNGAGLKLYWTVARENKMLTDSPDDNCGPISTAIFKARVGGDQANMYPEFVEAANEYIKEKYVYKGCY